MKPASCVLQNPFLKPENLCLAFSRFFGFAGVIRFVAAILGQIVVLVDRCSTFRFPFSFGPWINRFWDEWFTSPILQPDLISVACFGRRFSCAVSLA